MQISLILIRRKIILNELYIMVFDILFTRTSVLPFSSLSVHGGDYQKKPDEIGNPDLKFWQKISFLNISVSLINRNCHQIHNNKFGQLIDASF